MLLSRTITTPLLIARRAATTPTLLRPLSTTPPTDTSITTPTSSEPDPSINPDVIDERSAVQLRSSKLDSLARPNNTIWGVSTLPEPKLPAKVEELAILDAAQYDDPVSIRTGQPRQCTIRQTPKNCQNPETSEQTWIISFQDDGASAETWRNPLMGWTSSADPMAANMIMQMTFRNAKEAVYFAKKRGWDYEVAQPIVRRMRNDGATYQDNFLPLRIATMVKMDGRKCDQWQRKKSGASHYTRPLKYHGDGLVPQYGPNGTAEVAPHVEGQYKLR